MSEKNQATVGQQLATSIMPFILMGINKANGGEQQVYNGVSKMIDDNISQAQAEIKNQIRELLTSYQQQVTEKTDELNTQNSRAAEMIKRNGGNPPTGKQEYLKLVRTQARVNGALDILEKIVEDLSNVLK